jgi:hypothetical protein
MIDAQLVGGGGNRKKAEVVTVNDDSGADRNGLLVFTRDFDDRRTDIKALLNDTYGADMNQNVSFGGTPEIVHDGGDTAGWTGAADQGTWDFADTTDPQAGTNHVSVTSANNLDQASFTDATETDFGSYTALSGKVQLVAYDNVNNDIIVRFLNNGVIVGNEVTLDDYIDPTTIGSYQSFAIPKADFGIDTETVDEMEIVINRSGGTKPTVYFDVMQIEQTGTPAVFKVTANGEAARVIDFQITMADAITEANAKDYNSLLGLTALTNGIGVRVVSKGKTVFTGSFSRLIDFLQIPDMTSEFGSDGTNTWLVMKLNFRDYPVLLERGDVDEISLTVADDLSGLLYFRTFARIVKVI